ncbi:MAG TPA: hypothetical protein P5557_10145, partial [Candidatus Sumerlaeia bacterium]|nr:hypothetical protein [Candidatus Sumerlaeia bacterium]
MKQNILIMLLTLTLIISFNLTGYAVDPLTEVGHYGENISAVAVSGNIAVINEDIKIRILDITNPNQPVPKGHVKIDAIPNCLQIVGNFAYSAAEHGGVNIIDISNPTLPFVTAVIPFDSWTNNLWVRPSNDYAYVGLNGSVAVVDIRDKFQPKVVSQLYGFDLNSISGDDGYLYVVDSSGSQALKIYNLANPANPVYIGGLNHTANAWGLYHALVIYGNTAYVAQHDGILIVDIQDKTLPVLKGKIGNSRRALALGSGVLFASDWGGLEAWRLTDPHNPYLEAWKWDYPAGEVVQNASLGNIIFEARCQGLFITQHSGSSLNRLSSYSPTPGFGISSGLAIKGTTAFFDALEGLDSLDLSDPQNPILLQRLQGRGSMDIAISGDMLYKVGTGYVEA